MFFLINFFKNIKILSNSSYGKVYLIFLIASLLFGNYMYFIEDFNLIDTYYFLFVTATTVGFGDMSVKTDIGKLIIPLYMIISIGSLAMNGR